MIVPSRTLRNRHSTGRPWRNAANWLITSEACCRTSLANPEFRSSCRRADLRDAHPPAGRSTYVAKWVRRARSSKEPAERAPAMARLFLSVSCLDVASRLPGRLNMSIVTGTTRLEHDLLGDKAV